MKEKQVIVRARESGSGQLRITVPFDSDFEDGDYIILNKLKGGNNNE